MEREGPKPRVNVDPVEPWQLEGFLPLVESYQRSRSVSEIRRGRNRGFYGRILAPSPHGTMLGAHVSGEAVGFSCLQWVLEPLRAREVVRICDLFVSAEWRRLGIARALLNSASDLARSRGAAAVTCELGPDDIEARSLLDSLGARAEPRIGYELSL